MTAALDYPRPEVKCLRHQIPKPSPMWTRLTVALRCCSAHSRGPRRTRAHTRAAVALVLQDSRASCNPLIFDVRITVSVLDTAYKIDLTFLIV